MSCETWQEQVSLLIDAELPEPDEAGLFGHLEACFECRLFFGSVVRFREAARKDREDILHAADEVLPARSPLFREPRPARTRGWLRIPAGGWRVPAPVALGAAAALIVIGVLFGSRLESAPGGSGLAWRGERAAEPAVVVVCGLPPVEVVGASPYRR